MTKPLYVALVWHMHQPYYKDTLSGAYSLPWARLHALKDYLHMAELVAEHPGMRATFNLVPCLLEQLEDYAQGKAVDYALALSLKEAWTPKEKEFMLSFFFSINRDHFIRQYPRYSQLYDLRERSGGQADLFTDAYYRDLAAWFNLAWIDRRLLEQDATLAQLVAKGRDFTRDDLRIIAEKQREIIGRIIPRYRELEARGQIEITTSPYYHPILPLLIDTEAAREADPRLPLPATRFAHPEDAVEHLRRAIQAHERTFGHLPRGLWPSEGAVSQALISLPAGINRFRWIASDEGILANSLNVPIQRDGYGHVINPKVLYRPYRLRPDRQAKQGGESQDLQIIFRDVVLSDRIGFVYKHMPSREAADDLIQRLRRIRENLKDDENPYLVSIILDGENCWEEYEDNGTPFLHYLYEGLSQDPTLQPITVSQYLEQYPAKETIPRLFAGSWINHNLRTWIGEQAQNRAWEYLANTRQWLVAWQRENPLADWRILEQAWEEIYIAEGSDWFWWYYSHNSPAGENAFDNLFRQHLRNVYRAVGVSSPSWLDLPISVAVVEERERPATAFISPPLLAAEALPDAWQGAGCITSEASTGAMQRSQVGVRRLCYGYDRDNLYFRVEADTDLSTLFVGIYLSLPKASKSNRRPRYADVSPGLQLPNSAFHKEIAFRGWTEPVTLSRAAGQEIWERQETLPARLNTTIGEVRVPFSSLGVELGDIIGLTLIVARDGVVCQVLPETGEFSFTLKDFS